MSAPDSVPEITDVALPSDEPPPPVVIASEPVRTESQPTESQPTEALRVEVETATPDIVSQAQSTEAEADEGFQALAANWVKLERRSWQIFIGIVGGLLGLGWLVMGLAIRQSFDVWQWLWLALIGVIVAMLVWCSYFFPRRSFLATSWRLHPHGFEIRRGIWWRHRIFIPQDRIQHTDVHQGPLQRAYGLASLVLNTGGTHEPSITLDGIDMPLAESLREQLSKRDKIQAPSATKTEAVA